MAFAKQKYEGIIDGLYDDQSGYCTFGVGHLVHQRHKWKCFLLETAAADEAWKNRSSRGLRRRLFPSGFPPLSKRSKFDGSATTNGKALVVSISAAG